MPAPGMSSAARSSLRSLKRAITAAPHSSVAARSCSSPFIATAAATTPAARWSSSTSSPSTGSIHQSEIEHFSRLAAQWWDPHGEFATLHAMNPVRIRFLRSKIEEVRNWDAALKSAELRKIKGKDRSSTYEEQEQLDAVSSRVGSASFLEGLDVLDVGCGGGFFSEALTRLGARTLGIDAASSNIQVARAHAALDPALVPPTEANSSSEASSSSPSLQYLDCTAEALLDERGPGSFDVVCAMEVIEHVRNPSDFLRTLSQLVKPGGHLVLSTISRTPFARFITITMAEHVLRQVSPGTHTYSQYIKPEELQEFVSKDPSAGGLGWNASSWLPNTPERLRMEVRGTAYLPWKSAWQLADRNASPVWSQQANYFFWARKPFSSHQ
ncbi:Hexaprenyldihydroxybenzoate methyltransferase, mitochondrial [Tilletia horrida]|uniref:Ubiquinone biosynthesis O-methyltransferase, mitochondrial n=1 Tax=Tilletia horrida TaxID=155126 RepID=A0AAN6GVQ6_9BASI|nr:Hexaprenyldihydroxybenzoate methyltransferase, mitochondrial [Tilletia horrida]KAK0555269.1 Hexaprenyldihydroxybenzoate methyltransferase, mitochondrial [Tilletia horrida]